MAPRASQASFPGLHELEQVEAHGRAMHFFANHELLALELMALVLLRFPEAPPSYRMGLGVGAEAREALGDAVKFPASGGFAIGAAVSVTPIKWIEITAAPVEQTWITRITF